MATSTAEAVPLRRLRGKGVCGRHGEVQVVDEEQEQQLEE